MGVLLSFDNVMHVNPIANSSSTKKTATCILRGRVKGTEVYIGRKTFVWIFNWTGPGFVRTSLTGSCSVGFDNNVIFIGGTWFDIQSMALPIVQL